jgi:anti-sigma factor RsiW
MSDHATVEQLSGLIDGQLSLLAREAVSAHLRECPTCAALHEDLVEVAATLTTIPREHWTPQLTAEVLRRAAADPAHPVSAASGRDWSLPIAAAIAVAGFGALVFAAPVPVSAVFDGLRLNVFSAFAQGAGMPFGGFLTVLLLLPALGLLAMPLLRQR